jgi:hypothetical protein
MNFKTVIGIILLFFSVNFGISHTEKWLVKQGTAVTSTYLIIIEGFTNNFLAAGSILLGIGLTTIHIKNLGGCSNEGQTNCCKC